MNIRDLKYLVAIAEHKHFGKAADACCVSQPGLSMQIKKLEDFLGVPLFERCGKSVLLTEIGARLTLQAQDILCGLDDFIDTARAATDPFCGELILGVIPTLAPYLLPRLMPSLIEAFPQLKIYLVEEKTSQLLYKLKQGKLDGALLALPVSEESFTVRTLFEEEFLLAVHNSHPLAARKRIQVTELEGETLLLLEEGHCLRDQTLAVCQLAQAHETQSFQATSLETLRYMIAAQVGITLLPKSACYATAQVRYLSFQAPKPQRTIGLIWRSSCYKNKVLAAIADHMLQENPV